MSLLPIADKIREYLGLTPETAENHVRHNLEAVRIRVIHELGPNSASAKTLEQMIIQLAKIETLLESEI